MRFLFLLLCVLFFSCNNDVSEKWKENRVLIDSSLTSEQADVWGIRNIEAIKKHLIEKKGGRDSSGKPLGLKCSVSVKKDITDSLFKRALWRIEFVINSMNLNENAIRWYLNTNHKPQEFYPHFLDYDSLVIDNMLNKRLIDDLVLLSTWQQMILGYYKEFMIQYDKLTIEEYLGFKSDVLDKWDFLKRFHHEIEGDDLKLDELMQILDECYLALDLIENTLTEAAGGIKDNVIPDGKKFMVVDMLLLGRRKNGTRTGYEYEVLLDQCVFESNKFLYERFGYKYKTYFPSLTLDGKSDPVYSVLPNMRNMSFLQLQFSFTPVYVALKRIEYKKMQLLEMKEEVLNITFEKRG